MGYYSNCDFCDCEKDDNNTYCRTCAAAVAKRDLNKKLFEEKQDERTRPGK